MSKKVFWPDPKVSSSKKSGTYGSYKEFMQKANALREEQEKAQQYLQKAMHPMVALLEYRLANGIPLTVMRPLRYQTSDIQKADDDGFYHNPNPGGDSKFVDMIKVVNPGTQLVLKSLDPVLREFVFNDALGNEHALSFDERNNLLTQTDIFETVKEYLEGKKENNP